MASGTVISRSCGVKPDFQLFEVMPVPQCCQAECIVNPLQPSLEGTYGDPLTLELVRQYFPWQRAGSAALNGSTVSNVLLCNA